MERFWRYHVDHIIFWVATIGFHMFTRRSLIDDVGWEGFTTEILVRNSLLAIIIYANLFFLIPRFAQRGSWLQYVTFLLLDLLLYVVLKNLHDVYLYGDGLNDTSHFFDHAFYNLSIAVFYMAFSVALHLTQSWYTQRETIRRIEIEKLNTELDYLKAQINPHFLFNSLNTIFFQIDKHNVVARETLVSFSNMLRYQLYECNGHTVPIEKEIQYLQSYVDLQRMRKDDHYDIRFSASGVSGFTIAPLLLIPFIENAFKHVSHRGSGNQIEIVMGRSGNDFKMKVFNTYDDVGNANGESHGIGLANARRRLQLLYADRHSLHVYRDADTYQVELIIKLHDHET